MFFLVAHIFVIWTFKNSDLEFFNPNGNKDRESLKIMKPHPIQIITIFRLLGVHNIIYSKPNEANNQNKGFFSGLKDKLVDTVTGLFNPDSVSNKILENHLIEIGTGEGKSITLAVTAILFSFLGYEVNVACYSMFFPFLSVCYFHN